MSNYRELVIAKELHENIRDGLQISLDYWTRKFEKSAPREVKGQNYQNLDMPRGGSDDTTLDKVVYNINHFTNLIHTETETIDALQICIDKSKESMLKSNELMDKVAFLKYEKDENGRKKYTLQNIADMLVYSVDYIKEISARV
jgi:hypothetical protein